MRASHAKLNASFNFQGPLLSPQELKIINGSFRDSIFEAAIPCSGIFGTVAYYGAKGGNYFGSLIRVVVQE